MNLGRAICLALQNECRKQLQVYVDLDVTYFMLYFADLPSTDGLKLFSEERSQENIVRGLPSQYATTHEQ